MASLHPDIKQEPDLTLDMKDGEENDDDFPSYNRTYQRDLKLLEAYRRMPILYDRDHADFRFIHKKERAWRQLSQETGLPVELCKKRITYIRARFTVERRVIKNGAPSSDWPLMDKLKFLHKHIQMRSLRAPSDRDMHERDEQDEDPAFNNPSSSTPLSYLKRPLGPSDDEDSRTAAKRCASVELDLPFKTPGCLQELSTGETADLGFPKRDEHSIFGEYVAEVLRKLPPTTAPATTLQLMQVLVEAQQQALLQAPPPPVPEYAEQQ